MLDEFSRTGGRLRDYAMARSQSMKFQMQAAAEKPVRGRFRSLENNEEPKE